MRWTINPIPGLGPKIGLFELLQQLVNVLLGVCFVLILKVLRVKYTRPAQESIEELFQSIPETGIIQVRRLPTQETGIGEKRIPGLTKS